MNGHKQVVKYLHEQCHVDVETKDDFERTPIYIASCYGHLEVVKYLHEKCHAVITEDTIGAANNEEIRSYLRSHR